MLKNSLFNSSKFALDQSNDAEENNDDDMFNYIDTDNDDDEQLEEQEQQDEYFLNLSKQNQSLSSKFQEIVHYQTELDNEESISESESFVDFNNNNDRIDFNNRTDVESLTELLNYNPAQPTRHHSSLNPKADNYSWRSSSLLGSLSSSCFLKNQTNELVVRPNLPQKPDQFNLRTIQNTLKSVDEIRTNRF
jgi:hypothetical protein